VPVGGVSVVGESFTTTVGPFSNLQWPQGGVLRLRVVDGNNVPLPYQQNNDATASKSTIVVGNPGQNPSDWQFLGQKPQGTPAETQIYYQRISAPATLADFQTTYGLTSGTAVEARYYNRNDLGIARDVQCTGTILGGVACLASNFGAFGGAESAALAALEHGSPASTFAMVYTPPATSPNAVAFMVYDASGKLATTAQLDTVGDNSSVPQSCINCHGAQASYDAGTHTATGGALLAFDPLAMDFATDSTNLTFTAQQNALYQLDQLVSSSATAAQTELIAGEWMQEGSFNPGFVPGAWSGNARDATLYAQVIAPFCRSCHASVADDTAGLSFRTPADLVNNAKKVAGEICGAGPNGMPVAQQTATEFFGGGSASARALLLEYLDEPGSCAEGQPGAP
jgi:cytochrome c553